MCWPHSLRVLVAAVMLGATAMLGCLPAFAPNIRAKGVHAGLTADARAAEACMSCHVSEAEAVELDGPASAPLVADWMLAETRACTGCHAVRPLAGHAAEVRLRALAEVELDR